MSPKEEEKHGVTLPLNNNRKLERSISVKDELVSNIGSQILLLCTAIAVVAGVILGVVLKINCDFNKNQIKYFGFVGEIFLRMLKLLILPLIGFSLINSIAALGPKSSNKIALQTLVYYFTTTLIAVLLGLILVLTIKPGKLSNLTETKTFDAQLIEKNKKKAITTLDTFLDLIRNLFADNLIEIAFKSYETKLSPEYDLKIFDQNGTSLNLTSPYLLSNFENSSELFSVVKEIKYYKATAGSRNNMNVLGLIMFCGAFGYCLASMGQSAKVLLKCIDTLNNAVLKMIQLVMYLSPLAIASLIVETILEMDSPMQLLSRLSMFVLTVTLGLFIHALLILPGIYVIFTRRNVLKFGKNMLDALFIALATASSAAALPTTLVCCEKKNKISKVITQFIVSIGSSVNMDGSALYESVAVIFIAQLNGRDLSFMELVVAVITTILASIGAAAVPGGIIFTLLIVLNSLNLPIDQIPLILTVDWILDRLRTPVNVWGDSIGAGIVYHLNKHELENKPQIERTLSRLTSYLDE